MITGRTLMGHNSSKNQQLDDHYFGAIPSRVAEFMRDLEIAGHRLGIPLKTRHNEVAPNQFELAPIFGETNLANDQNQLVMNLMNKIARKHGFVVLLHEKPFAGVNGSGKHNNWSLGTDTGTMLLAPGKDAKGNLQFVTFFRECARRRAEAQRFAEGLHRYRHERPSSRCQRGTASNRVSFPWQDDDRGASQTA